VEASNSGCFLLFWHRARHALTGEDTSLEGFLSLCFSRTKLSGLVPNGAERHGARGAHTLAGFSRSLNGWNDSRNGTEGNDTAMKDDTGIQHRILLWVCEMFYGFVFTTNHNHFSRLKGDLFPNINGNHDALLLYTMELARLYRVAS